MASLGGRSARWKQPEYTGENRCLPCTAVNVAITALLAGVAAIAWLPLAAVVGSVGLAAIYFRGYLVPGTPTLTKRYLPERIHRLFGAHGERAVDLDADALDAGAVERALQSLGTLEPCPALDGDDKYAADGDVAGAPDDLCLTSRFRRSWYEQFDSERADATTARRLFSDLDIEPESIEIERRANAFVAVAVVPNARSATTLAKWESAAAFVADAAADVVLREWSADWADLAADTRLELVGALRLWLDRCPSCAGSVSLDEETVESCCRSVDVVAATCEDCETRLFEARFSADAAREA